MRVARYMGEGRVEIVDEPMPECPDGGLLVQTEACGLCSGELMSWYMDRKIPHVLGHEVSGLVMESKDPRFPVGSRVFPHHHASCMKCEFCKAGQYVHCAQWKRTKLVPGGMADFFAVGAENLTDTHRTDGLSPSDAALIEPLACVEKSLSIVKAAAPPNVRVAVIGLGAMGLLHLAKLKPGTVGFDTNPNRVGWAYGKGFNAQLPNEDQQFDAVFVCPGNQAAFDLGLRIIAPGGVILMFAPLGPNEDLKIGQAAYFNDIKVLNSYSCGPPHCAAALAAIKSGQVKAENICSHFIELDQLPEHYVKMKAGEILKPMVVWS